MIVFLNGEFVPEERATVSVFDRGFLYGDGLFETMRVFNGKPFRWRQHWERLERGAAFLKIGLPFAAEELRDAADQLFTRNQMPNSLLRVALSRGVGARGYSPKSKDQRPTLVMSLHPAPAVNPGHPPRWKLVTSSIRLPANDPLAAFKTANKLPQIRARSEADAAGADEALLLNTDGVVVEGTSCNLFWLDRDTLSTPPATSGILPGVTRAAVLEIAGLLRLKTKETALRPEELRQATGIFLSLSSLGLIEAQSLDGREVKPSAMLKELRDVYLEMVRAGTA